MGLSDIEKVFVDKTGGGNFFNFYTTREISRFAKESQSNVRTYIRELLSFGALKEFPFNHRIKAKKYQLNKTYYVRNYCISECDLQRKKVIQYVRQ